LAPLAGFMGLARVGIAGLCSLAVKVLSVVCRIFAIKYGISGFDLSSCFLQFMFLLKLFKSHHTPLIHASGVIFQGMFMTEA